jgi:hypothetical protein
MSQNHKILEAHRISKTKQILYLDILYSNFRKSKIKKNKLSVHGVSHL